jgi:GMP synthase-like glutamine amidotransferase
MLVVVQNDPEVPAGAYGEYLQAWGVPFRLARPYAGEKLPSPADCTAVVVLGGAMGVHEAARHPFLVPLKEWIADIVAHGIPYLGICLGGQLLADVLGAPVLTPSPFGEKGTLSVVLTPEGEADPLFAGVSPEFVTFQWHNDAFDVPAGALRLAFSATCPNQAFRFGRSAWGTQFHPEVTAEIVDLWARWTEETSAQADRFAAEFTAAREAYCSASTRLLANFLAFAHLR